MVVVIATRNKHKIQEIGAILSPFGYEVKSLADVGLGNMHVEEDGDTFEENSLKKAKEVQEACGFPTIADDSGLMVDALDGAPGVYSARYAGHYADDENNNAKLLYNLHESRNDDRSAKFVAVITMVFPEGDVLCARGECKGHIQHEPTGRNGFGYDPLFVPEGWDKSFAELTSAEKNQISHRAKALFALQELLEQRNNIEK